MQQYDHEAMIEGLCEQRAERGYQADVDGTTIPGYVVIADIDTHRGVPYLTIYRTEDLQRWWDRAQQFLATAEDAEDWEFADVLDYVAAAMRAEA